MNFALKKTIQLQNVQNAHYGFGGAFLQEFHTYFIFLECNGSIIFIKQLDNGGAIK